MTETELQSEIKRLTQEKANTQMQLSFLKQQSIGVGMTFANIVRELLLAMGDPEDHEQVQRAKKHAKELLKNWELSMEQQNQPAPQPEQPNGLKVVPTS